MWKYQRANRVLERVPLQTRSTLIRSEWTIQGGDWRYRSIIASRWVMLYPRKEVCRGKTYDTWMDGVYEFSRNHQKPFWNFCIHPDSHYTRGMIRNISIMTATGCGNLGDECILENEFRYLRQRFPEAIIHVFTYDIWATYSHLVWDGPPLTHIELHEYFPNDIRTYPFRNIVYFFGQLLTLARSDILIIGGWGLFYDNEKTDFWALLTQWNIRIWIAKLFHVPLYFWSLSLEITEKEHLSKIQSMFQSETVHVSVRDMSSMAKLEALWIRAELIPDAVFLSRETESTSSTHTKRIGIAVRAGYMKDEVNTIRAIYEFCVNEGYTVIFLTHSFHREPEKNDAQFIEKIFPGNTVFITRSLEETRKIYRTLDMIIAMRLHAGILAVTHALPFLMLSYGPKTESFSHMIDPRVYLDAKNFSLWEFKKKFLWLETERSTIKFALQSKSAMIATDIRSSLTRFFHGLE